METVSDFIFLGSKITADGDCSHEIKRRLLLRGKVGRSDQPRQNVKKNVQNLDFETVFEGTFKWSRSHSELGAFRKQENFYDISQGYGFSSSHVWM